MKGKVIWKELLWKKLCWAKTFRKLTFANCLITVWFLQERQRSWHLRLVTKHTQEWQRNNWKKVIYGVLVCIVIFSFFDSSSYFMFFDIICIIWYTCCICQVMWKTWSSIFNYLVIQLFFGYCRQIVWVCLTTLWIKSLKRLKAWIILMFL